MAEPATHYTVHLSISEVRRYHDGTTAEKRASSDTVNLSVQAETKNEAVAKARRLLDALTDDVS